MAVARIQLRRDTSSNWTTANTILTEGELGYETNTSKVKIGDGTTPWNSLNYLIYPLSFSDLVTTPTTIAGYGITDAFDGVFSSLTSTPTTIAGYGITDAFDGAFSSLTNTPTTLGGYGITDSFDGAFSSLTGTPTTLAGYGITDSFDGAFSSLTGTPTTLAGYGITDGSTFDGAFSSLTGKPTTLAGYGITDAFDGAFSSLTFKPTTISGYGITDAFNGAFSSLSGTPTTLAGYGITDAAPLQSPGFTGTPTAPTAPTGTNTTQIATTAFVETAVSNVIDSAPGALDTLNELAAALGDDANFSTTITNSIATKAPLASASLTGTPTAPTAATGTNTTQIATTAFVQSAAGSKSSLTDFSVSTATASGVGSLSYNNTTGVFTFTPAQGFDGAFSSLTGKPTTIAGYGITDAFNGAFSSLTGKPTTIAGYGITDAFDGAFSSLTGKPTTIAGYGITDAFDGAFSSLTGKPTTIAGYGITDAFDGAFSSLTGKPTTIAGYGITDAFDGAFSSLTGRPTTIAGYGITDALTTGADADIGSNDFITTGKVYFANMFAGISDLPSATTYHGMFAHVHSTGAAYFAHAGNWIQLANNSDVTTKAPLASPSFTGIPIAPTASSGTNTTQLATTEFVTAAVAGASGTYTDSSVDTHLNTSTASSGEVLSWNGTDYDWVAQSGGGGGASVTTSDSAPSSPSAGDLWYNTDAGGLFVYYTDADSSQWVEVVGKTGPTGAAGGSTITVSDAAPSSPVAGQLWWNSTSNKLYIYYTDANSSQWVQATTPGADGADGATGATGATGAAGADGASPGRNKFINGNFDVWQRGTSRTTSGFASDRWRLGIVGNSQCTFSQQSFALGQTDVPFNPKYYQRAVVTAGSAANSYVLFNQRIEDVRTFQGETVTVSFWAKADAVKDFVLEPYQFFGTGGSAGVPITPQTITLSTTWTKYTKTFSIPSITGKTLGTDPNSSWLGFFFWLDAGSNWNSRAGSLGNQSGTFDFAQIQVETGTTATDFETEALGITVEKCQRYFVTLGVAGSGYATGNNQTASAVATVTLPTRMRAVPTVTANITQGALTNTGAALTTFNFYNTGGGLGATSTGSGRQWWGALVEFNAET